MTLTHSLERTIRIRATRDIVFSFFTESERWAAWWGAGSTIDPRPGGEVYIRHPGGVETRGQVLDITPPARIVFTYGFVSGKPIPPGGSRVQIDLETEGSETRVHLTHQFPDEASRDEHVQGWRYQLSLFANVVAQVAHRDVSATVDDWLAVWSEADAAMRNGALARIATPLVRMRDQFSNVEGLADLSAHLAAAQQHMPGMRLRRRGDVRQCQGVALADWVAETADGQPRAQGTNVFVLDGAGRIESVTGFWAMPGR